MVDTIIEYFNANANLRTHPYYAGLFMPSRDRGTTSSNVNEQIAGLSTHHRAVTPPPIPGPSRRLESQAPNVPGHPHFPAYNAFDDSNSFDITPYSVLFNTRMPVPPYNTHMPVQYPPP